MNADNLKKPSVTDSDFIKTSNEEAKIESSTESSNENLLDEELESKESAVGGFFTKLSSFRIPSWKGLKEKVNNYFVQDSDSTVDVKDVEASYQEEAEGGKQVLGLDYLTRVGIFIVVVGIGGFILWSLLASIGSGVIASGLISVDSLRKSIQHLEGGVVSAIYVKDGDLVESGDLLIELDQTRSRAEYNLLQTRYFTELGNITRLRAEMEGDDELTVSQEFQDAVNEDLVKGDTLQDILDIQGVLFSSKKELRLGEKGILEARLSQINRQIEGLNVQLSAKGREIELIEQELDKMKELSAQNIVDLTRLLQRERELSQARGEVGRISADVALAEVQAGEARLRVLQIDRQVRQEAAESVLTTQEKIFDLNERLIATENVLRRTQIRAPQRGYVIGQSVTTIGGVVAPGAPLMEIVPIEDTLIIDAKINATDIDNVDIGKQAEIKLVAFSQRNLPAIYGEVLQLSADAVLDQEARVAFYKAKISLPEEEIEKLGLTLVPGMPAEVLIKGRSRSAFSYFTEPLTSFVFRGLNEE